MKYSHHFKKDFMKKIILAILTTLALSLTALPAFAVSDYSVTIDSNFDGSSITLCNSERPCSDYHYLSVDVSGVTTGTSYYYLSINAFNIRAYFYNETSLIYEIPSGNYSTASVAFSGYSNFFQSFPNAVITVTLSESIPGCTTCPTPEPCPDPDEPFIVGLFREGFWGVATAVVALIVPIVALFLVFRLVHDFFWGRG